MERVDDAPPEQVPRHRRRGKKQAPRDQRGGTLRLARHRRTKQQPESWPGGTKLRRRGHRQVHLQRVREQQHAVGGRTALQVDKVHHIQLVDERARPVIEHRSDRHVVGDAEGEVHVGEAVAGVGGERAHGGSGDHARILLREPEQLLAELIPLRNGEHEAGVYLWLRTICVSGMIACRV